MYVERTINPTEPASLRSNVGKNSNFKETFHDIFQRTLNSKSNSRPPKIELTGLLIPCHHEFQGHLYKYKLGTESSEYFLSISDKLTRIAKTAEWEEVTVKGYLELGSNIFEVEKITLTEVDESAQVPASFREAPYDLEGYEKIISQRGKLEPAIEYLAS